VIWQLFAYNTLFTVMFTVHSVHKPNEDTIQRLRKRPKKISINAKIVRTIFNDELIK